MTRIVRKAVAAQQNNNRARGGTGSDRQIFHSEFNGLFAEELANYSLDSVVTVTYTEAETLINDYIAGTGVGLVAGTHYKLSDKADKGIVLLAISPSKFALEGQGIFLNPDFQNVGDYSSTPIPYLSTRGVWSFSLESDPSFDNGSIVFWNGLHYIVIDDGGFDTTDPATNGDAYEILVKSVANGYIEEVDFILYDFVNDVILERQDKRGNKVANYVNNSFQWGTDRVANNIISNSASYTCINQRGVIIANTLLETVIISTDNTNEGTITGNLFKGSPFLTINKALGTFMLNCDIYLTDNIVFGYTFNINSTDIGKQFTSLGSTFETTLDMDDVSFYDAGTDTLTVPIDLNYIGLINLLNCAANPILKITNLPNVGEVEFKVATPADTVVFTNTAIGLAVANNLVADVVGVNTLTGRTNGNDFIRYRKSGTLNVRTTGSIMA